MESLVTSLLGKYLRLFIKDFQKDQLNIQAMKGTVELKDVDLVCETLQELLLVPTSILVTSATCDALTIQLPSINKILKKPIVVSVGHVDLQLEEPDEVPPMPNNLRELLQTMKKEKEGKLGKKSKDDILRNLNFQVERMTLSIKLKNTDDLIRVEVTNFGLFSVNEAGERVTEDLPAARRLKDGIETTLKGGQIGSVLLTLGSGDNVLTMFDHLPAKLRMENAVRVEDALPVETRIGISLADVVLKMTKREFVRYFNFSKALNACLERPMPLTDRKATRQVLKEMSSGELVLFSIILEQWSFELLESSEKSLSARGAAFEITASPPRPTVHEGSPEIFETSHVNFKAKSFSFGETDGLQIVSFLDAGEDVGRVASDGFISFQINSERSAEKREEAPATELVLDMKDLTFDIHRDVWARVYRFADLSKEPDVAKIDLTQLADKAQKKQAKLKEKIEWSLADLYQASKVSVALSNVAVNVPPTPELEERFAPLALEARAARIHLTNSVGWAVAPHVGEGLMLLPESNLRSLVEEPSPEVSSSKWEAGITGFMINLKYPESHQCLGHGESYQVYGRVLHQKPPHVDVSVRGSPQTVSLLPDTLDYLDALKDVYTKFTRDLFNISENKEEMKEKLKEKIDQVKEGVKQVQTEQSGVLSTIADSIKEHKYVDAVDSGLRTFTSLLYVSLEHGVADFPLKPGTRAVTSVEFEQFEAGLENSMQGQQLALQMRSFSAKGFDHERLALKVDLTPLRARASAIESKVPSCVSAVLNRQLGEDGSPIRTLAQLALNNMRITTRAKKDLSASALFERVTQLAETASESAKGVDVAGSLEKANDVMKNVVTDILAALNFHWRFSLKECELHHSDASAPEGDERGVVQLGSIDWDSFETRFRELEDRLVASNVELAAAQQREDEMQTGLREYKRMLTERDEDFMTVNSKLMEERVRIAQLEEALSRAGVTLPEAGTSGINLPPPVPSRRQAPPVPNREPERSISNPKSWFGGAKK